MSVRVVYRKETVTAGPVTYDIWGFRMESDGSLSLVNEEESILGIVAPHVWEAVTLIEEEVR